MGNNWSQSEAVRTVDIQASMYCKKADNGAGFMNTFSYCPDYKNQKCIQNSYLFINLWMKCISGNPIEGWQLDIDRDCNAKVAKKTACPLTFVPFKDMPNKIITKQANLGQNEKCTITLDATDSVARVTFT